MLALMAGIFLSCRDKCKETRVVIKETPIFHSVSEIRNGVSILVPQQIQDPGKMYVAGNYLYIIEIRNGIHVIENHDPSNPVNVSFVQIPGIGDFAFQGNTLYADSYSDIVSFDISDPGSIKETGRVKNVYRSGWFNDNQWTVSTEGFYFFESTKEYVTETVYVDCEDNVPVEPVPVPDIYVITERRPKTLSRFAIQSNFLYSVTDFANLEVFNLINLTRTDSINTIKLDLFPFSIFSYKNKLFISSTTGSVVYDNSVPETPRKISIFPKGNSCDKTVFQNDIAYVISLQGSYCGGDPNKLHLMDISDATAPSLIKTYSMTNTKGLAIDFPTLYLCEGINGFKVFDVTDKMNVDKNLLSSNTALHANDVILSGKNVIVNAEDGIYQFDGTNPKNLKQLSKITFKKAV